MKRLFDKDEVWFAILWIVIYVVGFSNADMLSETMGIPKLLTVFVGAILSIVLWFFIKNHQLSEYYGLVKVRGDKRSYLYFLPLVVISCVNLWNGVALRENILHIALYVLSMCFVGFLEEVIFRGFLFQGMRKEHVKAAIVVSSLTFGMGHAINLLLGAPLFETMLQLVYASAIGFCYTAVFYVSGSLWPCILSHIFVNTTSIFAIETGDGMQFMVAIVQTILSVLYGLWLLKRNEDR